VRASLAATSGVEVHTDLARYLLAGADVVMTTSALLRHEPSYATDLLDGLTAWMSRKGFDALVRLRGLLAVPSEADAAADHDLEAAWPLPRCARRGSISLSAKARTPV
jgi:dihydroorotate dehydrogenase (fumarate)